MSPIDSFTHKLNARDIRPTAMRLLVLQQLARQPFAVSLVELEQLLDTADRVTIYRTLKTFLDHKLVHSIDDGTGAVKYALCADTCDCQPSQLHAHFHCTSCQKTYCLTESTIPAIHLPQKFVLHEAELVVKGLCERCS